MDEDFQSMFPGLDSFFAEWHSGSSDSLAADISSQRTSDSDQQNAKPILNDVYELPSSGAQTASVQLPTAGISSPTIAQPGDFQTSTALSWFAQPTENLQALSQPSSSVFNAAANACIGHQPHGTSTAPLPANGSRRSRPSKPRIPDLQQQLHELTERFAHLSKENGFLRSKLKALERVLPQRGATVGWLAAVHAMQSAPEGFTSGHSAAQAAAFAQEVNPNHQDQHKQQRAGEAAAYSGARAATLAPAMAAPSAAASGAAALPASASWGNGRHTAAAGALPARTATAAAPGALLGKSLSTSLLHSSPAALVDVASTRPSDCSSSRVDAASARPQEAGVLPAWTAFPALVSSALAGRLPTAIAPAVQGTREPPGCSGSLYAPAMSGPLGWAAPSHLRDIPALLRLSPGPDGDIPAIGPAEVEELRRCTGREFGLLWKHVVLQLGVLVMAAETFGPASPQYGRLERFIHRSCEFVDRVSLLAPSCFLECMNVNLDTWQPERPSDEFWAALGGTMKLSEQQLSEVESLARVFERNVTPVIQERLRLASELSAKIAASEQAKTSGEAIQVLDEVEGLVKQLERNALKEYQTHWDISDFLCYSVLDPLQVGRLLTAAYPYIPDGVAIMHATEARIRKASDTHGSGAD